MVCAWTTARGSARATIMARNSRATPIAPRPTSATTAAAPSAATASSWPRRWRSRGITDLRHGCVLDDGIKAVAVTHVPLPAGIAFHAIAARIDADGDGLAGSLLGDGLVPVSSALGRHPDAARDLHIPAAR